ncbi:MAG: acylphosphatase [Patescibacteria group bacterium]
MRKQIKAIISGRVQLVMYRDFARRKAKELGIVGMVENFPDGTVLVVAEGEKEVLDKYISTLEKGPILARVDNVSVAWGEPNGTFSDFMIVY